MTLTQWRPVNDCMSMQREVNRLFSGMNSKPNTDSEYESAVWSPKVDVMEDQDKYSLSFDLPGIDKSDVKMSYSENTLKISGERKSAEESEDVTRHRIERYYGKFYRSFNFSTIVDANKISANYNNGVLTVVIPKAEESKPKEISIN